MRIQCVSLRGRRPWQSPVFNCLLGIASSLALLAMTTIVFAQPAQKPPHENAAVETGVITGVLLKDGKSPLGGHIVILEILNGHQLILTLPKTTDAKGSYQFKNIFMSPDFSYAVSAEFGGKTYRTDFVSLKSGEKSKKMDLAVGAGAKEGPSLPPPIDEEMRQNMGADEHKHVHKKSLNEYQLLAIILSIGAVGYAIWRRKKT